MATMHTARTDHRAFTLIEVVVGAAIVSILLAGLTSAVFLATRALPGEDSLVTPVIRQSQTLNQIVSELQYAQLITERGEHAITFTVADRDNDDSPQRIRYAWSGEEGDPLTRQYDSQPEVVILDDVAQFDLSYDLKAVTEEYAGAPVESSEMLLATFANVDELKTYKVETEKWVGQYFEPSLVAAPEGALSWRVTRAWFMGKRDDPASEQTLVQIRTADAEHKPTETVLTEYVLAETELSSYLDWVEVGFDDMPGLDLEAGACLVFQHGGGGPSGKFGYDDNLGIGRLRTYDAGATWSFSDNKAVYHYIYGTISTPGPPLSAKRDYVTGVRMALRTGEDSGDRVDTAARALNAPELLSAVWELEFDCDPTTLDMNRDDLPDWARRDGTPFDPGTLVDGIWHADAPLDTCPDNCFTELTTVELRFRNTSVGGRGAMFCINSDCADGTCGPLVTTLQLQADSTQELTVYHKLNDSTELALLTVSGLSPEFVRLRLVIEPQGDTVNIQVDGKDMGTYYYNTFTPAASAHYAAVLPSGSTAEFDYVRIRVGGS